MSGEQQHYISYLLRLWQTRSEKGLVWRASLESPQTRKRMGFTSLARLFAYLEREMRDSELQEGLPEEGSEQ